jgi:indolepyruvate ferredoxin oxidoreductase
VSNCISIEPIETELGRKRRINQSSCNKDYSCVKGLCPSFVSVIGGRVRKARGEAADSGDDALFADLPAPEPPPLEQPWNVLVTGIGGSGVITVGALLGMAAHLEGKGCSVLDVTGLAQKNGPVTSHVRIAAQPSALHATRIATAGADLVLGCDMVVTSSPENLSKLAKGRTTAVVNSQVSPTSDFASKPDLDLSGAGLREAIAGAAGEQACHFVPATHLATALLGDAIFTNPFLMGYAYQRGRLPLSLPALERAIELNGRAVAANRRAFAWGRLAAHDLEAVERAARPALRDSQALEPAETLEDRVARRVAFLTDYQNADYAERYRAFVTNTAERAAALPGGERLGHAVARYLFKLMARKDEFEVARLYTDGSFQRQLDAEFEGDYRVVVHLAPPRLPILDWFVDRREPDTGRTKKIDSGLWLQAMRVLAKLKFLRDTPADPFGRTPHRRLERRLIDDYRATVEELLSGLTPENLELAVEIASIPEHIRGFESVREQHLESALAKQNELLDAFRRRAPARAVEGG